MDSNSHAVELTDLKKVTVDPDNMVNPEADFLLDVVATGSVSLDKKICRRIATKEPGVRAALRDGKPNNWFLPGPALGIFALCVAIGCMFFSLVILLASNNDPTTSWKIQPTVYLATSKECTFNIPAPPRTIDVQTSFVSRDCIKLVAFFEEHHPRQRLIFSTLSSSKSTSHGTALPTLSKIDSSMPPIVAPRSAAPDVVSPSTSSRACTIPEVKDEVPAALEIS